MNPFPPHHYVNSPTSITGSVLRSVNILRNATYTGNVYGDIAIKVLVAFPLLLVYVTLSTVWAALTGLFFWPLRLLRRGSRARRVQARQHAEMMEQLNR